MNHFGIFWFKITTLMFNGAGIPHSRNSFYKSLFDNARKISFNLLLVHIHKMELSFV